MKATTTFLLASLLYILSPGNAQAQCTIQTFTSYAVSSSETVNSTGTDILTTVVVDGSASMQMIATGNCPDAFITAFNNGKQNIQHLPSALNQIGSIGGWSQGPSTCAECYISYQTNLDSGPLNPGQTVTITEGGQVYCDTAGLIFLISSVHTFSIRLSAYIFFGLSNGRCTWIPSCAGKCSSQHTTNTLGGLICFTTGPYKQCYDLLRDGVCWDYRTFCYGKESPGICTN